VLSKTAPSEIVPIPADPDAPAAGAAGAELQPNGQTQDVDLNAASPNRRRPVFYIGGVVAVLLACGLIYMLVASPSGTHQPAQSDGGAGGSADAGTVARNKTDAPPKDAIVLSSTPSAKVYLDGKEKGSTPLTLKVSEDKHKLTLVADTWKLVRREVNAGEKLDIKLEPAQLPSDVSGPSVVKVKCKTEGVLRILVDDNDSGLTCPADELMLSPGKHTLAFYDPTTLATKEKKIKVKKGKKPTKVKVKF
jgi:hypothetical protein